MLNKQLANILKELHIAYEYVEHPAVYTSEQAREMIPPLQGASAKNLFLRDRKGKRHFLVILDDRKEFDLTSFAEKIGSTRLSFGSAEGLKEYLGIEPGAVSPLAVINDPEHRVEVWMDEELAQNEAIQCHPLVNTATMVIGIEDLRKFFDKTGHNINMVSV